MGHPLQHPSLLPALLPRDDYSTREMQTLGTAQEISATKSSHRQEFLCLQSGLNKNNKTPSYLLAALPVLASNWLLGVRAQHLTAAQVPQCSSPGRSGSQRCDDKGELARDGTRHTFAQRLAPGFPVNRGTDERKVKKPCNKTLP